MKKKILIIAFLFLGCFNLWALECSLEIQQSNTRFSQLEITTAVSNILSPLLNFQKLNVIDNTKNRSFNCSLKIITNGYIDVLAVHILYNKKEFLGGSPDFNLNGLQEALVRAFYKSPEFVHKTCIIYGKKYNLNCILYQ